MKEVQGNLVEMALNDEFDVIGQGCNCFNTQNSGIAKTICDIWPEVYEVDCQTKKGDYNKLGTISICHTKTSSYKPLDIINCYTQFTYGRDKDKVYVNYDAIAMCMDKLNRELKGKKLGLPMIGCGLANGDWNIVKNIIETRLVDVDVTVVYFK